MRDDDAMSICSFKCFFTSDNMSFQVNDDDDYSKMDSDSDDGCDHDDDATSSASCCHFDGKVTSTLNNDQEEEEEGVVEQHWNGDGRSSKRNKSSSVSVDSKLNQNNEDRLFWETCLAS